LKATVKQKWNGTGLGKGKRKGPSSEKKEALFCLVIGRQLKSLRRESGGKKGGFLGGFGEEGRKEQQSPPVGRGGSQHNSEEGGQDPAFLENRRSGSLGQRRPGTTPGKKEENRLQDHKASKKGGEEGSVCLPRG